MITLSELDEWYKEIEKIQGVNFACRAASDMCMLDVG